MNSNILYNEKNDNMYMLIEQLGEGSFSQVWFAIEINNLVSSIKNKIPFIYNLRALKIHFEECDEQGMLETKINDILIFDNKKSDLINYPIHFFNHKEKNIIIVWDSKKYKKLGFVDEII